MGEGEQEYKVILSRFLRVFCFFAGLLVMTIVSFFFGTNVNGWLGEHGEILGREREILLTSNGFGPNGEKNQRSLTF